MTRSLTLRSSANTVIAMLALGGALLLSPPFAAAEPPAKNRNAPAPAGRDGSLFTAFVPVLRTLDV